MADLTLNQRFGSNAIYNATNKTITIAMGDLTDAGDIANGLGLNISELTSTNVNDYASKILYSLLLLNFQQQPQTNNDDSVAIYITNGGRRDITRNGVSQFAYLLTVNNYTPNNLAPVLDPDLMA